MNKAENLSLYLEYFEHPHLKQNFLHIAGTKGKTSVAYYLYQILVQSNKTAGLFVSPHIFSERERIQRNGQMISEEDLLYYKNKIVDASQVLDKTLSFFEEFLLVSLLYFKDHPVEYVVLEVGIGGKKDTTNFVTPVISIISRVKKDHQEILGKTLWSMFRQKLGIIKPKVPFIIGKQNFLGLFYSKILTLFKLRQIKLLPYKILCVKDFQIQIYINQRTIRLIGPYYMVENFILAYSVLHFLNIPLNFSFFEHQVPGRMQQIPGNTCAYLDGAHNEIAVKVLVKTLKKQFLNKYWKVILCIRKDKKMDGMLKLLKPITQEFIILPWDKEINPKFDPEIIITKLKKQNLHYTFVSKETLNKKLQKNDNILVTGSFYHLPIIYEQLSVKEQ